MSMYNFKIKALEQRIKELELLLQTAEQNAADQRFMKNKACEQRDEQVKKNAELAAQVSEYDKLINELIDHLRYNKRDSHENLDAFWGKQNAISSRVKPES